MAKVIHLGTQILTSFAVVDDDGNKVQDVPALFGENKQPMQLRVFSEEGFKEAYKSLVKVREDINKQLESQLPQPSEDT